VCTLASAAAIGLALGEFISWVEPGGVQVNGARWILFGLLVLYAAGAFLLWRVRPRHAAQLVNAAMLALIGIVGTVAVDMLFVEGTADVPHLSTWWALVAFATSVATITFAIQSRERGPAWTAGGALVLTLLTLGSESSKTLLGWPLVLLIAAAMTLAAGFLTARRT